MKFDFRPKKVTYAILKRDTMPHLLCSVYAGDRKIGYCEIHLHSHRGKDKKLNISFGFTAVVEKMPEEGI